jgi:acyl dehydratase
MKERILAQPPSLSRLYLTAAGTAARQRLSKHTVSPDLPAERHTVADIAVDPLRLTRFQHLLRQPARDWLPSGYVHALAFPVAMSVMTRADFPLPLLGMVHLHNHAVHRRPIHFSEPLTITAWAERLRGHRAGTQVDLVASAAVRGEPVWEGRSTYLAKGVFGLAPNSAAPDAAEGAAGGTRTRPEFTPPAPTASWRLDADTGRGYAAVSADFNPIHLSALSARALGLKRPIAHGMYLASRVLGDVGGPGTGGFEWSIDFDSPVFLPGVVAVAITDDARAGAWSGSEFVGWNQRSLRCHFTGSARRLEA